MRSPAVTVVLSAEALANAEAAAATFANAALYGLPVRYETSSGWVLRTYHPDGTYTDQEVDR